MVGARGFEPPTSASRTRRATKLRYAPPAILYTDLTSSYKGRLKGSLITRGGHRSKPLRGVRVIIILAMEIDEILRSYN